MVRTASFGLAIVVAAMSISTVEAALSSDAFAALIDLFNRFLKVILCVMGLSSDCFPQTTPGDIWKAEPGLSWQWQIQGTIDTSFDVDMYDIDLFDAPQSVIDELHDASRSVVCYFSAGSYELWRSDGGDFPAEVLGETLSGWEDEKWLDIRNTALRPIMERRLDLAVSKNCDGVEPDNVDAYLHNTGFGLSPADQIVYNKWLASEAHKRGLSIGLKNDVDQVQELVDSFDWALNEQCFQYNECDKLTPFVEQNKAVFGVEYIGETSNFCPQLNALGFSWLKKDLELKALPRIDCMDV